MEINCKYIPSDKMITLISDNYQLIQVMTRFGIKVGFGDKTVREVCDDTGVDCATFLAVVNFVAQGFTSFDASAKISVGSLMLYLKQSHIYFLEYCLPGIRRKLLDGMHLKTSDVTFLMLKLFDEYTSEVRVHMEYEERTVFRHIELLLSGSLQEDYHINTYSEHHEQVADKLRELKNIIIKYCPADADPNLLNDALYSIYSCEKELENHCLVEDYLLVPEIVKLEESVRMKTDNKI